MHSPQPTGQEGIKLSSHLAGQGWVAVLRRAVGDHEVGPWRSEDKSEAPAQLLDLRGPGAVHALSVYTPGN